MLSETVKELLLFLLLGGGCAGLGIRQSSLMVFACCQRVCVSFELI
jgi:hypothetical protein